MPANYAELGDSGLLRYPGEHTINTSAGEHILQGIGHLVLARVAPQSRPGSQGGDVERYVGRAAGPILDLLNLDHRYRCFW